MSQEALEGEIKDLIVATSFHRRMTADEIESDAPLFIEGLGLDSIDALELAIAIDKTYGVRIDAEDEGTREVFRSVHNLARYVAEHRAAP